MQCGKLAKVVDKLAGTLKNLVKTAGSKSSVNNVEAHKLEIEQTQQMLQET
jgi:hypothetical protein